MNKNVVYQGIQLVFSPDLAKLIGLHEAITLQQIHYWIEKKMHFRDGFYWVYNTYGGRRAQVPFMSIETIKRCIGNLEKLGVVVSGNYNKKGYDKTKWYTINYPKLYEIIFSLQTQMN